ncbi:MAG: hypothetical protein WAO19_12075 [Candidatus Kryptoniota bacterium]
MAIAISSCHGRHLQEKPAAPIDTTITRLYDYTGDGVIDTSYLHITGEDFDSSFSWTYDLRSNGETIIHRQGSDAGWDSLFAEKGFEADSGDYTTSKIKFFYHELGLYVLQPKDYDDSGLVAQMNDTTFGITYPFLRDSCGLGDQEARAIMDSLANTIMDHTATLVTFIEIPESNEPLKIYVARLKKFVPIYED